MGFFCFCCFFWRLPLSPLSCPCPLCTRRNRQLGGPVKVRRSASYISSPLSRAPELTSALIIAAGLWRRSLRTPGGKPWARMRQWQGASGGAVTFQTGRWHPRRLFRKTNNFSAAGRFESCPVEWQLVCCVLCPAVPGHKYAGSGVRTEQLHGAASGHWRRQQTPALRAL